MRCFLDSRRDDFSREDRREGDEAVFVGVVSATEGSRWHRVVSQPHGCFGCFDWRRVVDV
jgi:hypothetical protein